jgi:FKBP-type peptidyl-prolyl cis-trans isomerase 2
MTAMITTGRGAPYLKGIDWHIIPQTEVALLSYKAGELHTIGVQPKDAPA